MVAMNTRTFLGALAIGVMLSASPVLAANTGAQTGALTEAQKSDAKKHYGDGERKFKAGDYAGALTDFQAADAIKSTPQSQRYVGLCQDNLGHYGEAVTAYESFLTAVPDKMKKEGDEIKARVAVIKAMPAKVHIETTPSGASILADGKTLGTTPTDVELAPGKHLLHIELAGFLPVDRDVDLQYGAKQEIKSELQAKAAEPVAQNPTTAPPVTPPPGPTAPPPPEPPKESHSKIPAFITGGLAIVAIGIGTGFGIAALSEQSSFNANPTSSTADTGENFALVADMAFGVAITLGVTAAVLFLTKDDDQPPPPSSAPPPKTSSRKSHPLRIIPTPFVTPNGGGAGAFLRF
jgi:PEGA domain